MMGCVIQQLRYERGWSQPKLAKHMCVSTTTIKKWESDASDPSARNIKRLAILFRVSPSYLFGMESYESDYFPKLPPNEQLRARRLMESYCKVIIEEMRLATQGS